MTADPPRYHKLLELFPTHHQEIASLYNNLKKLGKEETWLRSVLEPQRTLLVIDMQNDFISGSLAVQGAEELLAPLSEVMKDNVWDQIIFTKDWHPANHVSFLSNVGLRELDPDWLAGHEDEVQMFQEVVFKRDPPYHQVLWPDHCVQGSVGQ